MTSPLARSWGSNGASGVASTEGAGIGGRAGWQPRAVSRACAASIWRSRAARSSALSGALSGAEGRSPSTSGQICQRPQPKGSRSPQAGKTIRATSRTSGPRAAAAITMIRLPMGCLLDRTPPARPPGAGGSAPGLAYPGKALLRSCQEPRSAPPCARWFGPAGRPAHRPQPPPRSHSLARPWRPADWPPSPDLRADCGRSPRHRV